MREPPLAWNSVLAHLVVAGTCAVIGAIALPLTFGPFATLDWVPPVWLLGAILASVPVLLAVPAVSRPLGSAIGGALPSSAATPSQALLLARLVGAGVALIVTQAILRHPVAVLLGGDREAATVEAGIAAAALAGVLALLVWTQETARPMLQALTLRAIDAAIPTVEPAPVAEPTRTVSVVGVADDQATLRAPRADEATVRAARADEATVRVARHDGEPTVRAPRPDERTLRAPQETDRTLRAPREVANP